MRAWLQYHGLDPLDGFALQLGRSPIELMSGASVASVMAWVEQCVKQTGLNPVVFIDTVSRNFGAGDESKTADMAQVVANIDKALRAAGATVVLVHHTSIGSQ